MARTVPHKGNQLTAVVAWIVFVDAVVMTIHVVVVIMIMLVLGIVFAVTTTSTVTAIMAAV